mgnify:CR=1 FL=1
MENILPRTVLFADTNPEARQLYVKYLKDAHIDVVVCEDLDNLLPALATSKPLVLIFNSGQAIKDHFPLFVQAKAIYPELFIITMGYAIAEDDLDALMRLGVSCHVNRSLTRPQDIVTAAEQVMYAAHQRN